MKGWRRKRDCSFCRDFLPTWLQGHRKIFWGEPKIFRNFQFLFPWQAACEEIKDCCKQKNWNHMYQGTDEHEGRDD